RDGLCDHSLRRGLRPVVYTPVGGVDGDRLWLHLHPIRGSRSVAAARMVSTSNCCHQCGDRSLHADAASGSCEEAACGTDAFVAIRDSVREYWRQSDYPDHNPTPLPLVSWNHRVGGNFRTWSLMRPTSRTSTN